MFDQDTWRFINTFAPWLSALGTFTAVSVSLYLARRASRLKLRVFPAIAQIGFPGDPKSWREYFQVRVVNHGREAIVKSVGWWLLASKQMWIVLPSDDPYTTKTPAKLDFGEEALFLFRTATYTKDARQLLEFIRSSRFPELTLRRLRIGVYTSTGETFRVPLDKHLRRFLRERLKERPGETTSPGQPV